jgi:hypothetical protein
VGTLLLAAVPVFYIFRNFSAENWERQEERKRSKERKKEKKRKDPKQRAQPPSSGDCR